MKLLVCGSRWNYTKEQKEFITKEIEKAIVFFNADMIVEGCCVNSPDELAEQYCKKYGIDIEHHPSTEKNHLKRNREMISKSEAVLAFWDGFSFGTAYTIALAVANELPVKVIKIKVK